MTQTILQIIILGAPGSGKGTEAQKIAADYHIEHISTGDLLRSSQDPDVKKIMSTGAYLPDAMMIGIVKESLKKATRGWILDGFPRTPAQAEALETLLKDKPQVLFLNVPDAEIIERLSLRRTCPSCKAIYHLQSSPPQKENLCDKCASPLITRDDDKPEVVANRLKIYHEKTAPLITYYEKKGYLKAITGSNKSPSQVHIEVQKLLSSN